MQITLKQRDIELALKMYLSAQGISLLDRSFNVEFTAGRKDSGLSASIDIGPAEMLATKIMQAVEATSMDTAPSQHKSLLPASEEAYIEEPEGEVTQEAALAASVPFQEAPTESTEPYSEVQASAGNVVEGGPVTLKPATIFAPDAEVPNAAPANVASVSLFA